MCRVFQTLILLIGLALPLAAGAEERVFQNGSDRFIAGDTVVESLASDGDSFVAAQSVTLDGAAGGDLHVAGFDVVVRTDISDDLYASGATVDIRSVTAGDVTAAGYTVRTSPSGQIGGNARIFGRTLTLESPVAGAVTMFGQSVVLNAHVEGDVRVVAGSLSFGDNARIDGVLRYSTEDQVAVPASVASADRVEYVELDFGRDWDDFREAFPETDMPALPSTGAMLGAFLVTLLFFALLGALALGLVPDRVEAARQRIIGAPGRALLLGFAGLALLFGLVPISAMTIVGIPLIPVVLLTILVVWTVGYALGAYSIALRIWTGMGGDDGLSSLGRVALLMAAITVVALLNFIPFVGWVANFTLVLFGIGAMSEPVLGWGRSALPDDPRADDTAS